MSADTPLFAAHTELPWPAEPHLALWLGTTLLREYRGDGHIAALTAAGVSGIDALITHTATGRHFTPAASQAGRGWTDELWATAIDGLRSRGILTSGPGLALTPAGLQLRVDVKAGRDGLAMQPWHQLGADNTETLRRIATDLSWAVVNAGTFDPGSPRCPDTSGHRRPHPYLAAVCGGG